MSKLEIEKEVLIQKADEASKALQNKATKDAETLIQVAAETAEVRSTEAIASALLSKAAGDAKILLQLAAETAEFGLTEETANALLYKATETAKELINKAAETSKELIREATGTSKELIREATGTAKGLISEAAETAETLLASVKILEGIIFICMYCHEIRDDEGHWQRLEKFITEHSETEFSSGICPCCAQKQFPQYIKKMEE